MKTYEYSKLSTEELHAICTRKQTLNSEQISIVQEIEKNIVTEGNKAIIKYAQKFDNLKSEQLKVPQNLIAESEAKVNKHLKKALEIAITNITLFHQEQLKSFNTHKVETTTGIKCWQEFKPIEKVGLYIPSGNSSLFSTVLMLAIPALIAGCKEISICTPGNSDGFVDYNILYCAKRLGIKNIYQIGGAQAIFALAYGSHEIQKVDKIFGPGNSYVTIAKMIISSKTAIDMPAGPSEVLIIADSSSNPQFLASDFLAQLEHGVDSQAVLVCNNLKIIEETEKNLQLQIEHLNHKNLAKSSLDNSYSVLVENLSEAYQFSNLYAPEHLILHHENHEMYINQIENAGSVFCGAYSPESLGDYASGTNHTLPTSGFSRSYSGLNTLSFGKLISFQQASIAGFKNIAPYVEIMAEHEKLIAHKNAVSLRLKELNQHK